MKKQKTLLLLDSHAIIHRAYHAVPDFKNSKGEPTGALFGIINMLFGILERYKPDAVIACYDLPHPTYRHEIYEAYKGHRKKSDEDLVTQIKSSREIFKDLCIPMYDMPGFEADDILGTIVHKVTGDNHNQDEDYKVIIASGDMDTMQLIKGDQVLVYTLKKGLNDKKQYLESKYNKNINATQDLSSLLNENTETTKHKLNIVNYKIDEINKNIQSEYPEYKEENIN